MMGRQTVDQSQLFYLFNLEKRIPERHLLPHLAYRWFCRLDLDDKVPDHSTFSANRHGRFRDSDLFRQIFEAVVRPGADISSLERRSTTTRRLPPDRRSPCEAQQNRSAWLGAPPRRLPGLFSWYRRRRRP